MRLRCQRDLLRRSLKQCLSGTLTHRCLATAADAPRNAETKAKDIAILGGGITGLASAFFLSQHLPDAQVTIYEASSRLGGWLHSKQIDVSNGKVVFEQGPRNLRPSVPNGIVTLELIHLLGLESQVLMTSKNSVAAQNRFLYYPDHLVRMPGPGSSLLSNLSILFSESVFKGVPGGLMREIAQDRPPNLEDESVGSFISRRCGSPLADNILSAVLHGIYAGDIYQLSARSILPSLWLSEKKFDSVLFGPILAATSGNWPIPAQDLQPTLDFRSRGLPTGKLNAAAKSSVFTFKNGLGELADRLTDRLEDNENVHIRRNSRIRELQVDHSSTIKLTIARGDARTKATSQDSFTHVISTLPGKTLNDIVHQSSRLTPLSFSPSVTVMVVNLFFSNPSLLPVHGFGYLLPRSLPFAQNPERALGVVFDSDATIGQDNIPGTKVTVMLGGHWWDSWTSYPDEEEGKRMAQAILARHLNIDEQPRAVHVGLQRNCIPQYTVGHIRRMAEAHDLLEEHFKGRLMVAGNSYTGVGLNDCVRAARDVAFALVAETGKTGLDQFLKPERWVDLPN